jgi:hypothetical protein
MSYLHFPYPSFFKITVCNNVDFLHDFSGGSLRFDKKKFAGNSKSLNFQSAKSPAIKHFSLYCLVLNQDLYRYYTYDKTEFMRLEDQCFQS